MTPMGKTIQGGKVPHVERTCHSDTGRNAVPGEETPRNSWFLISLEPVRTALCPKPRFRGYA